MEAEHLMILYEDNSVEVHYTDGSRMLLSPCGAEFLYEKALLASSHPLQPPERVRQRTPFAISIYRQQLLRAVDFRNQYTDHPYLPSDIIPHERKKILFTDTSEAHWPSPHALDETACLHNGSVKLTSLDGHASLFLPELHQDFTVEFLCKVSQQLPAPAASLQKRLNPSIPEEQESCGAKSVLKPSSNQLRTSENNDYQHRKGKTIRRAKNILQENNASPPQNTVDSRWSSPNSSFEHCRIIQHMSVSSCPEEWKYALSLAFMFYRLHSGNKDKPLETQGREDLDLDISNMHEVSRPVTCLPQALPLSCQAPYLHRWSFSDFSQQQKEDIRCYMYSQPIKVVWCKGVIYRFFLEIRCLEIYPGDGSVFRSEGSFEGKYFTRYYIQQRTRQKEETVYSVNSLPPDTPGSSYSVWTIISEAVRILQHNLRNMLSLTHNYSICCWKMAYSKECGEVLPIPVAEKIFPNVGRFFAYSDGKVHAVFHDGIILDTMWDFSPCYGKSQGTEAIKTGWCKLTSPEGTSQLLEMDHPGLYERYALIVVEWCKSLQKYKEPCADPPPTVPEENWSVAAELEKIKRFNFLVENSNIPCKKSPVERVPSSCVDQQNSTPGMFLDESISKNIAETLERTSKAISDIDTLLTGSLKQNTVRNIS